jgi:phage-related protein
VAYLPPVVARLSFDLGDLSAKIDEAKAKIHSLGDTIHIKTDIDNSSLKQIAQDTEAMHRIMGKNEAIRERVNLDDADAKARLTELTRDRIATVRVRVNKSDLDQAEGFLSTIKKLFTGGPDINLPFTSMGASPMGLAAIGAALTALLPELAGVVAGFAAAGVCAAAFAALAAPAVKHVTTAYGNLKAARLAYSQAQAKEQLDPSKTNEAALRKAADNLKLVQQQIGKMPAAEQAAITGITNLGAAFSKQSKAFEPKVFEVFASGLRLAATLLPTITPFANTFADSLSKIFTNLNKSAHGKGFQDFLKQFHGIEGPAIQAIAAGIGNVAGSVGRLLTVMSGKDVAHTLNIAFSAISGTIGGLTTTIRFLMNAWDGMKLFGHNVASAFDSARHSVATFGHDVASNFDSIRHTIASFSPGAIISKAFSGISGFVKSAFAGAQQWFSGLWQGAQGAVSKTISFFSSLGSKVKGAVSGAASWLIDKGRAAINGLGNGAKAAWGAVSSFFSGLGGKIKGFFAGASGWLVASGKAIMDGLLAGITSAWNKVATFLSSLAGKIKSLKGPLDYDRVMLYPHGQAIMQGLMAGMGSQVPALEAQLRGITSTIAGLAGNHAAPAGAADQPIHVHVHLDGREITNAVAQRSVQTQRRTGTNGMTKRTR